MTGSSSFRVSPEILDVRVCRGHVFYEFCPVDPEGSSDGGKHSRGEHSQLDILRLLNDLFTLVVGGGQLELGGHVLVCQDLP